MQYFFLIENSAHDIHTELLQNCTNKIQINNPDVWKCVFDCITFLPKEINFSIVCDGRKVYKT